MVYWRLSLHSPSSRHTALFSTSKEQAEAAGRKEKKSMDDSNPPGLVVIRVPMAKAPPADVSPNSISLTIRLSSITWRGAFLLLPHQYPPCNGKREGGANKNLSLSLSLLHRHTGTRTLSLSLSLSVSLGQGGRQAAQFPPMIERLFSTSKCFSLPSLRNGRGSQRHAHLSLLSRCWGLNASITSPSERNRRESHSFPVSVSMSVTVPVAVVVTFSCLCLCQSLSLSLSFTHSLHIFLRLSLSLSLLLLLLLPHSLSASGKQGQLNQNTEEEEAKGERARTPCHTAGTPGLRSLGP